MITVHKLIARPQEEAKTLSNLLNKLNAWVQHNNNAKAAETIRSQLLKKFQDQNNSNPRNKLILYGSEEASSLPDVFSFFPDLTTIKISGFNLEESLQKNFFLA